MSAEIRKVTRIIVTIPSPSKFAGFARRITRSFTLKFGDSINCNYRPGIKPPGRTFFPLGNIMRNKHRGRCYKCGVWVEAGTGHFERRDGRWRVQHGLYPGMGRVTCQEAYDAGGRPSPVWLQKYGKKETAA